MKSLISMGLIVSLSVVGCGQKEAANNRQYVSDADMEYSNDDTAQSNFALDNAIAEIYVSDLRNGGNLDDEDMRKIEEESLKIVEKIKEAENSGYLVGGGLLGILSGFAGSALSSGGLLGGLGGLGNILGGLAGGIGGGAGGAGGLLNGLLGAGRAILGSLVNNGFGAADGDGNGGLNFGELLNLPAGNNGAVLGDAPNNIINLISNIFGNLSGGDDEINQNQLGNLFQALTPLINQIRNKSSVNSESSNNNRNPFSSILNRASSRVKSSDSSSVERSSRNSNSRSQVRSSSRRSSRSGFLSRIFSGLRNRNNNN